MGFLNKAKDMLSKNADKVDTAINKAGDMVDKKTQGKYADKVNKVQDAARTQLNKNTPPNSPPPPAAPNNPPNSPPPAPNSPPPPAPPQHP